MTFALQKSARGRRSPKPRGPPRHGPGSPDRIVTLDLEGVLVPEIWIAFAEKTDIEILTLTTRDIPDYSELIRGRPKIFTENQLTLLSFI